MSRTSRISFIREGTLSLINERISFGLFDNDSLYQISKVLSYQGLYLSSGVRVDFSNLDENTVVVVDDIIKKDEITSKYNTSLSREFIRNHIDK